jgi:methionine sulfoxide reductase heme-binding subunit
MSLVLAASGPKAMWYLTRGTGVVALLLLTAAVVLGILSSVRWRTERWPRFVVAGLHRNVTLLAVAFVVVHVVTTLADGYAPIGLKDAVIPFLSAYRRVWLGLGAVAFDLLLALVITSLLRARIGLRTWRAVHWLAYASWPVALVHGLGTGTDGRFGWLALIAFGCAALVAISIVLRVAQASGTGGMRAVAAGAALVVPLVVFFWYLTGPHQRGWAARAGTPPSLLRGTATSAVASTASVVSASATTFDGRLVGRVSQRGPNGDGLVAIDISGRITGRVSGSLQVTLLGTSTQSGGVALTSSRVVFAPARSSPLAGSVTQLAGSYVVASLQNSVGARTTLALSLRIDTANGRVLGTVHGSPA